VPEKFRAIVDEEDAAHAAFSQAALYLNPVRVSERKVRAMLPSQMVFFE
jgi:hypothetical protein